MGVELEKWFPLFGPPNAEIKLSVRVLLEFLQPLNGLDPEVIVPYPHSWAVYEDIDDGDTYTVTDTLMILIMGRLNAVSLKGVLDGKVPLPLKYDRASLFAKLRSLVTKVHEIKKIFHRDCMTATL